MKIPFYLTEDTLMDRSENGLILLNPEATKDCIVRLPPPSFGKNFEIIQLSKHRIILHTNSNDTFFLTSPPARKLIITNTPKAYGRSLILGTLTGKWRITQSTFTESQLKFEE